MPIRTRFSRRAFLACLALQLTSPYVAQLHAQADSASKLTLDGIFNSNDFQARRVSSMRWTADGKGYTTLERSTGVHDGRDLVRYDAVSGKREMLVSAERLMMPGSSEPIEVQNYQWSADGKRLLIFTNGQRVWRQETRGDFYVIDVASGAPRKLGGAAAAPSTLMLAKFSPDGGRVAYVRANNLYVEDVATGAITPLTGGRQ